VANEIEVRKNDRRHLNALLKLKKNSSNINQLLADLQGLINDAVAEMEDEDVALVEKVVNVKAL
jgi:hypothetical protein